MLRFICGKEETCSTTKNSQNILNMNVGKMINQVNETVTKKCEENRFHFPSNGGILREHFYKDVFHLAGHFYKDVFHLTDKENNTLQEI